MAVQTTQATTSPPIFYGELMSQGVFPALNEEFRNLLMSGQTPFNYSGQRVAPFTPDQLQAFELARSGVGSYLPSMTSASNILGGALDTGSNFNTNWCSTRYNRYTRSSRYFKKYVRRF